MSEPLIIYHANCLDGFGAAYAAFAHFRGGAAAGCELFAASHGDPPPDCAGRDVYLLDFSYKRAPLKALCQSARRVTVLDHHISASEDLAGLEQECPNLHMLFDMDKSGAVLAWEYFHASPPPLLLRHVQDHDLWRFALPETRDVAAALISYPYDLEFWGDLIADPAELDILANEGRAINRYRRQMIEAHKKKAVPGQIAGYRVPVVNCPSSITSELLGELAEGQPFAAGYHDLGAKRSWSLRAAADGEDVARIASRFGGGGHRRAAGFSTALPEGLLVLDAPPE